MCQKGVGYFQPRASDMPIVRYRLGTVDGGMFGVLGTRDAVAQAPHSRISPLPERVIGKEGLPASSSTISYLVIPGRAPGPTIPAGESGTWRMPRSRVRFMAKGHEGQTHRSWHGEAL